MIKSAAAISSLLALTGCAALERWGDTTTESRATLRPLPLEGCEYREARELTGKYCAGCHTSGGADSRKRKALLNLKMDTYRDWLDASGAVPSVLDKDSLEGKIMPPADAPDQPTDAERKLIVEWVKRGSPNSDSGR